jgi:hypothetical protein
LLIPDLKDGDLQQYFEAWAGRVAVFFSPQKRVHTRPIGNAAGNYLETSHLCLGVL